MTSNLGVLVLLPYLITLMLVGSALAQDAEAELTITAATITDEHVTKAIAAIVDELYSRKQPLHFWDPASWSYDRDGSTTQGGGYTALVTLALLYAGESYQDPRLRDAIEHLQNYGMEGTYAIAVRNHVWAMLPPRFQENLEKDTVWLLENFSEHAPGWDYDWDPDTTRQDHSLRQYGALGLWEAAKRGARIDSRYWQMLEDVFVNTQLADGGWNYKGDDDAPRGSMVAAGLTVLFITQDYLHAEEASEIPRSRDTRQEVAIERGLEWMNRNFAPDRHPGRDGDFYYYLYGVERVGLAGGIKYFGEHDWYREGAAELLQRFCAWDEQSRTMTVHDRTGGNGRAGEIRNHHLAFGLMFLSRGRVPVAVNKLRSADFAWNNRPRDLANFVISLVTDTETAVNWQIVDLDSPPESWLDAPLLYVASHEALPWLDEAGVANVAAYVHEFRDYAAKRAAGEDATPPARPAHKQIDRIKRYLDLGGMVVGVAEGRSRAFAQSFEDLGRFMYPGFEWRQLPPDHWAYGIHKRVQSRRPVLRGLSNGVRELMILSAGADLAETFQAKDEQFQSHFDTMANLYFYASEMNRPRARLEPDGPAMSEAVSTTREATIVRAIHGGNWNPEPAALDLFAGQMAANHGVRVRLADHPLATIDGLDPAPELVIVSGVDEVEIAAAQQDAIRAYVNSGGVVLFETAGGTGEFTLSAEQMAAELFGQPIDSAQRSAAINGRDIDGAADLTRVEYRPYSLLEHFGSRETTPRLRMMTVDGTPRVFFSREDLSHALLDQPVWGVSGYAPASARELLANVLLFAME